MNERSLETWDAGNAYERYVGRWSRLVAKEFLAWLSIGDGQTWADVGCGTGSLAECILAQCAPREVIGIDRSEGFLSEARQRVADHRARFQLGDALNLPLDASSCNATVSGFVLNFVSDPTAATREMIRVTKPGGIVAAYVWDYAGRMEMMRHFWDAAVVVSPQDSQMDEGERFPLCQPDPLRYLFEELGLTAVSVRPIDIPTVFENFADYWTPFLGKQGPAPTYLGSVDEATKERIRQLLQARLVPQENGAIILTARAWAVQGVV